MEFYFLKHILIFISQMVVKHNIAWQLLELKKENGDGNGLNG